MKRFTLLPAALIASLAIGVSIAGAAPVAPASVQVSGVAGSPFAACGADLVALQRSLGAVDTPNSEVEPYLAVNPTNPANLIAVWQQDRWDNGGSRGNMAGVSFDGGDTWRIVRATRSSACTGNPFWARATDPWVTFSPDGTAYLMHLGTYSPLVSLPDTLDYQGMTVARSTDGGLTWGSPTTLMLDDSPSLGIDKNTITADPNDSDLVYAIWHSLTLPPSGSEDPDALANAKAWEGEMIFTRSTDGGASWEPVRAILEQSARKQTIGEQIVVRPAAVGGELVNVFNLFHEKSNAQGQRGKNAAVQISADRGETWSDEIVIANMLSADTVDPDTGLPVRTGAIIPDAAVDPTNGDVYVTWQDARFSGGTYDDAVLAMSTDGGQSWTGPVAVPRPIAGVMGANRQAFTPQVHVSADGRLAVSYYDFRHNDGADGDTETDYFVSQCADPDAEESDLCAGDWLETRVTAESFDVRRAPRTAMSEPFLGDYTGLADVPGAFATAFSVAAAGDPASVRISTVPFAP
jgi:hypothetical protein